MEQHVLIVGGGLNGSTLALALAKCGIASTIVDALPKETRTKADFDGRSYALAHATVRMLDALHLWDALQADAQPILEIKVSDGRAGEGASPFFLHFDHAEIEEGPMGWMVEDRLLRPALLEAVEAEPLITHLSGLSVISQSMDARQAKLELNDKRTLLGDLVVGADGRMGETATRAGIRRIKQDYGQTSLVCAIEHELPHKGIAHQFFMPAGPLAVLPLRANRCSIVWTEDTNRASEIQSMDDQGYLEELRPRFGDFLGQIRLAGTRFTYPLSLSLAQNFVASRLALVGDAAHGLHPIAGQGLNAGMRDIAALAQVLADSKRRGLDIGAANVLEKYQRWRRFDSATLAIATDSFNRLFSNDNGTLRALRDVGMGIVNAVPALRRGFIREAAGLTGDIPRLMKGQQL